MRFIGVSQAVMHWVSGQLKMVFWVVVVWSVRRGKVLAPCFATPPPRLQPVVRPQNNHTLLEPGTEAKSKFAVAQPVRRLLLKRGLFGAWQKKKKWFYCISGLTRRTNRSCKVLKEKNVLGRGSDCENEPHNRNLLPESLLSDVNLSHMTSVECDFNDSVQPSNCLMSCLLYCAFA